MQNGIAGEAVVTGIIIRNHGLNAGVAHILELLIKGAVHVGFGGT